LANEPDYFWFIRAGRALRRPPPAAVPAFRLEAFTWATNLWSNGDSFPFFQMRWKGSRTFK